MRLLSYLETLADSGTTVAISTQPGNMDTRTLNSALTASDTFLRLALTSGATTLIVQKSADEQLSPGTRFKFKVESDVEGKVTD